MGRERGLSGGVQMALVFPVALSIVLTTLQWAMLAWAEATALAAAQDGARAAAALGGADAHAVAGAAAGNASLNGVSVEVRRDNRQAVVSVHGHANAVLPGLRLRVSRTAHAPLERITEGR